MTDTEFQEVKQQAVETADGFVFKTFEMFENETQKAHMYLQIMGIRVLANIIASHMHEHGRTFDEAFYKLKSGIYKESFFILQEIHNGDREAVELK